MTNGGAAVGATAARTAHPGGVAVLEKNERRLDQLTLRVGEIGSLWPGGRRRKGGAAVVPVRAAADVRGSVSRLRFD
jgi:hypothetical protein